MRTTTSQQGKRCTWWRCLSSSFATALLAAAPLVASAQTGKATRNDGMVGAATLKGQTAEQILAAKVADKEVGSLNDSSKVFFFYNVKTGKFLSMGGYWGVHASLKDTPVAFWAQNGSSTAINFAQDLKTKQGSWMKWVENSNSTDEGVFLDRGSSLGQYYTGYNGWFLEKDPTDAKHNTYRLYTYTGKTTLWPSKQVYLSALGDAASEKNCDADTKDNLINSGLWDEHSQWRIISLKEIQDLMDVASDNLTDPLDLTFKLACPGFDRGRMDIDAWKAVATGGYARIGLEQCFHKFVPNGKTESLTRGSDKNYDNTFDKNYEFPYKGDQLQTFADREDYKRHMAKYFCMDVRGMHGYIYQKQNVTKPGTYVIECKGYSNTPKALLFAGIGQNDGSGLVEGTKRTTTLNQVSNMPADEQARLHVSELNMDYAGKEFYESSKYTNSVIVQVTQAMIDQAGAEGVSIAFGLNIGDGSQTPNLNEWTVFDDFRLIYVSNTKNEDLVLDELRGDLEYLKNGITYKNRVLRLTKTFKQNSWNSFVLPVDLTVKQLRDAFGGTVRLAKLKNLTNTELQFETVNLDENEKATAIQAYQPYIIFPTKTMEAYNGTPYTANITTGTGSDYKVTIQGQRFQIPNVTFKTTVDGKNDFSDMDEHWTTRLTQKAGAITAYGTFVRTFDPYATQNETTGVWSFSSSKGTIRPGYYDLRGSYFFDNGDVYYSDTKVRGLRGFSCWFKPNTNNGTKPAVYLDGVKQETELTAIGELIVGPEAANRYGKNDGVYNLQGQRVGNTTEGLPSGIYIVNGRKHVVR
mgnify:CR=1 FL=1